MTNFSNFQKVSRDQSLSYSTCENITPKLDGYNTTELQTLNVLVENVMVWYAISYHSIIIKFLNLTTLQTDENFNIPSSFKELVSFYTVDSKAVLS